MTGAGSLDDLCPAACGARRFRDRVAIVTGAAQGIGRATVERLGAEGASIVAADIDAAGAEEVAAHLRAHGVPASAVAVDLREYEAAEALVASAIDGFGAVDVLVNNVGGSIRVQPFVEFDPDAVREEIDRSLWTAMWGCRAVLPHMLERARGAIVNLGSNSPRGTLRVPYAAAKGGVFALTTSLAAEVATLGVRVNCVAPGGTEVADRRQPRQAESDPRYREWHAEMVRRVVASIPMQRRGQVHEQAAAVAFLASDDASFITGQILSVAGGATVP